MLRVYVIKAENLVVADIGNTSDPYVKLYSVYHEKKYRFGRSQTVKRDINPIWDERCQEPICCPFPRAQGIFFEIFDYDKISADDPLGSCYTPIAPETVGRELKLKVQNKENKESFLFVKIMMPILFFPRAPIDKTAHSIFVSLVYRPACKDNVFLPIKLHLLKLEGGNAKEVIHTDMHAIKISEKPDTLGLGGFTQVIRFNLNKVSGNYLPYIELTKEWNGVVNLFITSAVKEPKKGDIRRCDQDDLNTMTEVFSNDVTVRLPGFYNSGVVIKTNPKSLPEFKKIGAELIRGPIIEYAKTSIKPKFNF